jgi:hypothetical protein
MRETVPTAQLLVGATAFVTAIWERAAKACPEVGLSEIADEEKRIALAAEPGRQNLQPVKREILAARGADARERRIAPECLGKSNEFTPLNTKLPVRHNKKLRPHLN